MRCSQIICATALALGGVALGSEANACVDLRVENAPPIVYDPLGISQVVGEVGLQFSLKPNCQDASDSGIGVIDFALIDPQNDSEKIGDIEFRAEYRGADLLFDANEPVNFAREDFTGRNTARASLSIVVPRGQFGSGAIKQLEVRYIYLLKQCTDAGCVVVPVQHTEILLIDLRTLTVMSLGIAGSGQNVTIDLGELSSNEVSRRVTVLARSTTAFEITFESKNGQRLKRDDDISGSETNFVPYTAYFNGSEVTDGQAYVEYGRGGTSGALLSSPFWIELGDVSRKRAGTYRDQVTLTIQPLGL